MMSKRLPRSKLGDLDPVRMDLKYRKPQTRCGVTIAVAICVFEDRSLQVDLGMLFGLFALTKNRA